MNWTSILKTNMNKHTAHLATPPKHREHYCIGKWVCFSENECMYVVNTLVEYSCEKLQARLFSIFAPQEGFAQNGTKLIFPPIITKFLQNFGELYCSNKSGASLHFCQRGSHLCRLFTAQSSLILPPLSKWAHSPQTLGSVFPGPPRACWQKVGPRKPSLLLLLLRITAPFAVHIPAHCASTVLITHGARAHRAPPPLVLLRYARALWAFVVEAQNAGVFGSQLSRSPLMISPAALALKSGGDGSAFEHPGAGKGLCRCLHLLRMKAAIHEKFPAVLQISLHAVWEVKGVCLWPEQLELQDRVASWNSADPKNADVAPFFLGQFECTSSGVLLSCFSVIYCDCRE